MVTLTWVNIGSGHGLLPYGTKPLPEPMLTSHYSRTMAFTFMSDVQWIKRDWSTKIDSFILNTNSCKIQVSSFEQTPSWQQWPIPTQGWGTEAALANPSVTDISGVAKLITYRLNHGYCWNVSTPQVICSDVCQVLSNSIITCGLTVLKK